jgi:hypothetical protein
MQFEESTIIQLEDYKVTKTDLEVYYTPYTNEDYQCESNFGVSNVVYNQSLATIGMKATGTITQKEKKVMTYHIEIRAIFSGFEDQSKEQFEKILYSNGIYHLVSIARSYLAALSGLAHINPPIDLPFFDLTKPKKEEPKSDDNPDEQKPQPSKE